MSIVQNKWLLKKMIDSGALPKNCRNFDVHVDNTDGAVVIRYEVFYTAEELIKFGEALKSANEFITGKVSS